MNGNYNERKENRSEEEKKLQKKKKQKKNKKKQEKKKKMKREDKATISDASYRIIRNCNERQQIISFILGRRTILQF